MVAALPSVYETRLPDEYTRWVPTWVNADPFNLLIPAACIGTFLQRLLLRALLPLAAILGIAVLVVTVTTVEHRLAWSRGERLAPGRRPEPWAALVREGAYRGLPVSLLVLYFVLPGVSSAIFQAFNCERFEKDTAEHTCSPSRFDTAPVPCQAVHPELCTRRRRVPQV